MKYIATNSVSISISFVHSAISKALLSSDQIDQLLQNSKIPRHLMREPHARVSLAQYSQLLTSLMIASNDELLGHSDEPLPIGTLSLLTHWLVSSKNLKQALNRMVRFYQILDKGLEAELHIDEYAAHVEIRHRKTSNDKTDRIVSPFLAEFSFFCIHRIICWLRKEIVPIEHLSFQFEVHDYAWDYRPMFYGAPSSFSQASTQLSFAIELLDKPVEQNLGALELFLTDPNSALLMQDFSAKNWTTRVGEEVHDKLDKLPTLPELAEAMKIKPYTLQRRLAEEGITYLDIKNQLKRDAAIDLLVNTQLSIEEISAQLGFSEISPFTRSFKSWTGIPPSAYRKY